MTAEYSECLERYSLLLILVLNHNFIVTSGSFRSNIFISWTDRQLFTLKCRFCFDKYVPKTSRHTQFILNKIFSDLFNVVPEHGQLKSLNSLLFKVT